MGLLFVTIFPLISFAMLYFSTDGCINKSLTYLLTYLKSALWTSLWASVKLNVTAWVTGGQGDRANSGPTGGPGDTALC